ncbi:MAG: EpsG family protein, partial [Acutalibacteraceae bacterium]|nr:EpsG family protein [Acutalibacteraceae bacterium]
PITTLIYAIPVIIALWKRKFIVSLERPVYVDVLINMSCVATAISLIGNFTSGILFGRLPIYFSMGNFIILPWLINNCFYNSEKSMMKFCCYAGYFAYFLYYMYISCGGMKYYSVIRMFNC